MNYVNKNQNLYELFKDEMNDYKNLFKELELRFYNNEEEEIFFCTTNYGKYVEINRMLKHSTVTKEILDNNCKISLLEKNSVEVPEVIEDFESFSGNAIKKALSFSEYFPGHVMMAEDSGLSVEILKGEPGIFSARYFDKSIGETDRIWFDPLIERCKNAVMKNGETSSIIINKDLKDLLNKVMLVRKIKEVSKNKDPDAIHFKAHKEVTHGFKAKFITISAIACDGILQSTGYGETHGMIHIPSDFCINKDSSLDWLKKGFGYNSLFLVDNGDDYVQIDQLSDEIKVIYNHRTIAHTRAIASYLLKQKISGLDNFI